MGFLYNKFLTGLSEAEIDGQQTGEDAPVDDYTASEDTNSQETQTTPQDTGETNPNNMNQNPQQNDPSYSEEPPPEDYTNMEYSENPNNSSSTNPNMSSAPPEEKSEVDDIKKQEEELYNELTPEQLDIKHKELKTQYLNMYDSIISIIDRLGDVNVAEENIGIVEYVSNTLANLKEMLSDYVNDVYKTKSYIENSINYNRFLVVLNAINKILEEMNSKNNKN